MIALPDPASFVGTCEADGELQLALRHWSGGVRMHVGDAFLAVRVHDGATAPGDPGEGVGVVTLRAPEHVWAQMLAAVPPRFANDIASAPRLGLVVEGDPLVLAQYGPAIQRMVELLREQPVAAPATVSETGVVPRFDAPVGRYMRLRLADGREPPSEYRVYVEEAGHGIPLLLQHTAGSHGSQWRHLFECTAITDQFRLIAYDLPFHGKSLPPVGPSWWAEPYRLRGELLRSVPLALMDALALDRPVFMGCSVGGLLALDLAATHPGAFRSVISIEGALKIPGRVDALVGFWHPQVSNESKARMMEGLTSPTSPAAYRKETTQAYAAGWPPLFLGDLAYYVEEYDLRDRASSIDVSKTSVHILSGEYDWSATVEMAREAHEAITGSTFTEMRGVGHFPMSENPEAFLAYLLPVLDRIRGTSEATS